MIEKTFFGHMVQGDWVADDGSSYQPVSVFIGLLRTWDSRSVWKFMVKPDGSLDWTGLEANIAFANRLSAETMFVFGRPPDSVGSTVPKLDAWKDFVRQVVTQAAGRVKYWELWNEPELSMYWTDTPALLAEYCRIAYRIIKELQPDSIVLAPSMTELNQPWGRGFADTFFGAGGGNWCDAISFHHYQPKPEDVIADWKVLTGIAKKYNVSLPVYNTEFNYTDSDVSVRGAHIAQFMIIVASLGVRGVVYDPETEAAANDYTDDTVQRVADLILGASLGPLQKDGDTWSCVVSRPGTLDQELRWTGDSFPVLGPVRKLSLWQRFKRWLRSTF